MCAILTPDVYRPQISFKNLPVYVGMRSDIIIHTITLWMSYVCFWVVPRRL
jgi:hypothetical protein